jgi:hypothetical protein
MTRDVLGLSFGFFGHRSRKAAGRSVVSRELQSLHVLEGFPHAVEETFHQRCVISVVGLNETP